MWVLEWGPHARVIAPTADVLAILDRIVRRVARRLPRETRDNDDADTPPDVLAQGQTEAAATWRSSSDAKPTVRGAERLRAWHEGFSLHAGVVIGGHDRRAVPSVTGYSFCSRPSSPPARGFMPLGA